MVLAGRGRDGYPFLPSEGRAVSLPRNFAALAFVNQFLKLLL